MTEQTGPRWQPVTRLDLIAQHIDGMLETDSERYENLKLARAKPWVLDDYTIGRVIASFTYVDKSQIVST